ncbi:hypothetical protein NSU_0434 [Novosphingobium pentaromativorans US6-1]|uniref:Uncharacterized protein n=2 Tax=Novosphingobium pentaromativorans TaxID=205844 RepID=G6E7W3_9SPHN|nr:hypothetical protein NSU_0434 [Novosphingobium pentaromativorans US6-1]
MERLSFHTGSMKANPRLRSTSVSLRLLSVLTGALALAGCIPQVAAPPPQPAQRPTPTPAPTPLPPPASDWRDAPATPGDWQYAPGSTGSFASFAGAQFILRCERQQQKVSLTRAGVAAGPVSMAIRTTEGERTLVANPLQGGVSTSLAARDPLLDDIAFSRGRFAVQVPGMAALYIPSWTEVSRVIEDCR